jgi:hypothetical protein
MKKLAVFSILVLVTVFFMCKGDDDGGSSSGNFFYSATKEVTPAFDAAGSKKMTRALASGTLIYTVFELLRDYEYPADEGVIDMHNIYKVLYTAGQIYGTAESGCSAITEASLASPFDLGITDTYNCAGNSGAMTDNYANGFAIKDAAPIKYALLTYRWAPDSPSQEEHGILQGHYNEDTGDLFLKMIHNVHYASTDGFVVRSDIEGNALTHAFTIQSISAGTGLSSSFTSIVGKGISQGSGNYFLFRVMSDTVAAPGKYFCIPADATETELEAMDPAGSATVDANCSGYQTDVDAMTFLANDVATIPDSITDFTGSTILLSGF